MDPNVTDDQNLEELNSQDSSNTVNQEVFVGLIITTYMILHIQMSQL